MESRDRTAALALFIALALGLGVFPAMQVHARHRDEALPAKGAPSFVEVSWLSIKPAEIHQGRKAKPPAAIITVEIFHQALSTGQTITLELGTYRSDPPTGVSVSYKPATQVVTIPPGPPGYVTATANVQQADIGGSPTATVVVWASLAKPSPGLRVGESPPGDNQAVLKIRNP